MENKNTETETKQPVIIELDLADLGDVMGALMIAGRCPPDEA